MKKMLWSDGFQLTAMVSVCVCLVKKKSFPKVTTGIICLVWSIIYKKYLLKKTHPILDWVFIVLHFANVAA